MKKIEKKEKKLHIPTTSQLIVAKVIAVAGFLLVGLGVLSEVMVVGMYGLPLLAVQLAQLNGVHSGADWVIGGTLWALPMLFFTILLAWVHIVFVKTVFSKMFRWMKGVLSKTC